MTHAPWNERLSPYLDGELSAFETRELERHLSSCEICTTRLHEMRRLSDSIRGLEKAAMPVDLKTALHDEARRADRAAAEGGSPARRRLATGPWALASLGAAALVVVIVLVAIPRGSTPLAPGPESLMAPFQDRSKDDLVTLGYLAQDQNAAPAPHSEPGTPAAGNERKNDEAGARLHRKEAASRRTDAPSLAQPKNEQPGKLPVAAAPGEDRDAGHVDLIEETEVIASGAEAPARGSTLAKEGFLAPRAPEPGPLRARFITELILPEGGAPILAPIVAVPVPEPGRSAQGVAPAQGAPKPITTSARSVESSSDARSGKTAEPAGPAPATDYEAALSRLFFLVTLDETGRIVSVVSVGARSVDPSLVDAARGLLLAAAIAPPAPSGAAPVIVEVRLPQKH